MHDRHFAMLLLCRGILYPSYKTIKSTSESIFSVDRNERASVVDTQVLSMRPYRGLKAAFQKGMAALGKKQFSSSARAVFPFLVNSLRCFQLVSPTGISSPSLSMQAQWHDAFHSEKEHGQADGRSRSMVGADDDSSVSVSSIASSSVSKNGDGQSDMRLVDELEHAEIQVCAFLSSCMDIDVKAVEMNALTSTADDALQSIRRVLCDLTALHFINSDEFSISSEALPEVVRRNTVTMELLCTQKTLFSSTRSDREEFVIRTAKIGKYVDLITSLPVPDTEVVEADSSAGASFEDDISNIYSPRAMSDQDYDDGQYDCTYEKNAALGRSAELVTDVRRILAIISTSEWLPASHGLRRRVETSLGFHTLNPENMGNKLNSMIKRKSCSSTQNEYQSPRRTSSNGGYNQGADRQQEFADTGDYLGDDKSRSDNDDDEFFGRAPVYSPVFSKRSLVYRGRSSSSKGSDSGGGDNDDDSSLWAPTSDNTGVSGRVGSRSSTGSANKRPGKSLAPSHTDHTSFQPLQNRQIKKELRGYLARALAELLLGNETGARRAALLRDEKFLSEVDFVFATWRRPHLLLVCLLTQY